MNNVRKLLHHDKVEVRQLEEGLRGSWHPGVVVGVSESCRSVRYDELLCESGSSKLVESIPVSGAIEGIYQRPCVKSNYRGRIRPVPPLSECSINEGLQFGVCVDVLYKEAWWEGIIFDCDDGAKERRVYFPDEGDERIFKLNNIRLTLEWDEFSGSWRERGIWQLVSLAREYKKDGSLFQLIRRVWSHLKVHYGYQKMITEWTCGAYSVWKEYFREVICDVTIRPRAKSPVFATGSRRHVTKKSGRKSKRGSYLNDAILTRSMRRRKDKEVSLAVRTRRMCMSEPENSLVSAVTKGNPLDNFRCMQDNSTAADIFIITDSPEADLRREYDQVASVCCDHTKSPCCYINNSKLPGKNHFRKKRHYAENNSTPRKLKPSKIVSCGRPTSDGPKTTCQLDNLVNLPVLYYKPVDRRKGLIQKPKKVGPTVKYSVLRQGDRRRTSRRSIRKKRPPSRIKKISSKKSEIDDDESKPTLLDNLEESKSSQKEDNLLGSQCESTLTATDSCPDLGSDDALDVPNKQKARRKRRLDSVCFICQHGDELHHCDHCMASYHFSCVDPEEAAVGRLFCPSCACGLCGLKDCASNDRPFSDVCYQCSRQYHLACQDQAGISLSEDSRFCSKSCFEICARLHQLLRIPSPTTVEGLTWSITRSRRNDCNVYNERIHPLIQVSQVLNVFHECFQPIREPHTGRDLVADIVYNSGSKFRRLDFHGFYVMALVNADEVVCAATIRIHGQKVAEMPLIATPFKYRRQGMCRLLLLELEEMLAELGIERLVLPGIASLSETWVSSFGFSEMPASARKELLGYPFVGFQGTTLFQKILSGSFDGNAVSFTPRIVKTDDCPTSLSSNCGGIDKPQRLLRPITQTYSRRKRLNKELPSLKSGADNEGSLQKSMKLDIVQPECSQKNYLKNEFRRFSLCYKRKRKLNILNKEKTVMEDGLAKKQPTLKYVYKRRRIQAGRNSSD